MNRKQKITATLSVILLVLVGLGAYIYTTTDREEGQTVTQRGQEVLFPFGEPSTTTPPSERDGDRRRDDDRQDKQATTTDTDREKEIDPYRQITTGPVSGAVAITPPSTGTTTQSQALIQYAKRENGHIFRSLTSQQSEYRISNTTIPRVHNTIWTQDGGEFYMRLLSDDKEHIRTFYGDIISGSENGSVNVSGQFLQQDITQLAVSPTGQQIFYLIETQNGSRGFVANTDGSNARQIFNSPLSEWLVKWPENGMITLTTKPSSGVEGYMYSLNPNNGAQSKLIDGVEGLTTNASPDGSKILYGKANGGNIDLFVKNLETNQITDLNLTTLPEKCEWNKNNSSLLYCAVPKQTPETRYPDAWYKGLVSFNDDMVVLNTNSNGTRFLFSPQQYNEPPVDVTQISLSPDGNYLTFINKKNNTLWGVDLTRITPKD